MAPQLVSWAVLCTAALLCTLATATTCPPQGFDSVQGLDLQAFLSGSWFVQQQMITAYQRENQLYCVRARYQPNDPSNLARGIQVNNFARQGSVSGPSVGGAFGILAYPDSSASGPSAASKLAVGPSFLAGLYAAGARSTFGPYWVVSAGKSADGGYAWAIVSGGPPRTNTGNGCAAGPVNPTIFDVNGAGLWLFSRKQIDPAGTAIMRQEAARLGFDLSVLKQVQQEGCNLDSQAAAGAAAGGGGLSSKGLTINLG